MSKKAVSKHQWLTAVITGLVILMAVLVYFFFNQLAQSHSPQINSKPLIKKALPASSQELSNFGLPLRIKIPKISVDAPIEQVGLTASGAVDVPKSQANAAWFKASPRPGEIGNAIIDGHYGFKNKIPSAFDRLYQLRPGDKVYIEDDYGVVVSFTVSGNRRYDSQADASGVFVSGDGKSHLNLITCEGAWDQTLDGYPERLVIFSDKD